MSLGTKFSTCLRKAQFRSRGAAERFALRRLWLGQRAYQCNRCCLWHLTSRPLEPAASGTEARRAGTVQQGPVHDGPVPKADAQNTSKDPQ